MRLADFRIVHRLTKYIYRCNFKDVAIVYYVVRRLLAIWLLLLSTSSFLSFNFAMFLHLSLSTHILRVC